MKTISPLMWTMEWTWNEHGKPVKVHSTYLPTCIFSACKFACVLFNQYYFLLQGLVKWASSTLMMAVDIFSKPGVQLKTEKSQHFGLPTHLLTVTSLAVVAWTKYLTILANQDCFAIYWSKMAFYLALTMRLSSLCMHCLTSTSSTTQGIILFNQSI